MRYKLCNFASIIALLCGYSWGKWGFVLFECLRSHTHTREQTSPIPTLLPLTSNLLKILKCHKHQRCAMLKMELTHMNKSKYWLLPREFSHQNHKEVLNTDLAPSFTFEILWSNMGSGMAKSYCITVWINLSPDSIGTLPVFSRFRLSLPFD